VSSVQRYQAGKAKAVHDLHSGRWVRVRDTGRVLVVGTPLALARSRAGAAVAGGVAVWAGTSVVLIAAELAVVVGWLLLVAPALVAVLVFGRAAVVEFGARDTLTKRNRREAAQFRAVAWAESDEPPVAITPTVPDRGPVWAHAYRQQAALPPVERRLPGGQRRELGR
jgi:hypothetical protein